MPGTGSGGGPVKPFAASDLAEMLARQAGVDPADLTDYAERLSSNRSARPWYDSGGGRRAGQAAKALGRRASHGISPEMIAAARAIGEPGRTAFKAGAKTLGKNALRGAAGVAAYPLAEIVMPNMMSESEDAMTREWEAKGRPQWNQLPLEPIPTKSDLYASIGMPGPMPKRDQLDILLEKKQQARFDDMLGRKKAPIDQRKGKLKKKSKARAQRRLLERIDELRNLDLGI